METITWLDGGLVTLCSSRVGLPRGGANLRSISKIYLFDVVSVINTTQYRLQLYA